MPRLFLAIDFPDAVLDDLVALQQSAATGVRWIPRPQLHLTVHFLGETDLVAAAAALQTVTSRAFELSLAGVGMFRSAHGGTILWAGVHPSTGLTGLHAETARAFAMIGYRPEARPYSPHLTLARCRRETPRDFLQAWLERQRNFTTPSFTVDRATLYSSVLQPTGPRYQAELTVPLHH